MSFLLLLLYSELFANKDACKPSTKQRDPLITQVLLYQAHSVPLQWLVLYNVHATCSPSVAV